MKTSFILFIIVCFMHFSTLINITVFEGEWNGIVITISTMLFLIAVYHYGNERRVHKNNPQ